uniref:Orf2 protein n=1 Tax=Kudoa septempunctata TaxID=751907 RepID=A0A0H5B174_9CNID|nr:orf2 protein [Kudoa septempunctata]
MFAWIKVSIALSLFFWGIYSRIYWRIWATVGWVKPSVVEGSSLGGLGNHGLTCHMALFQGTLLRSDILFLILECGTFSFSFALVLSACFILCAFALLFEQPPP